MTQSFLIALREAVQCTAILALVMAYLVAEGKRARFKYLLPGALSALAGGFALGYIPWLAERLPAHETWTFFRFLTEVMVFYAGLALVVFRPREPAPPVVGAGLFALGFAVFFFEARSLGFIVLDTGLMEENPYGVFAAGAGGLVAGFALLLPINRQLDRIRFPRGLTAATLLIGVGALKFAFGGLGELQEGGILIAFERGTLAFLGSAFEHIRTGLLIEEHPFISVPFTGLMGFLSGDRAAMTLMVIFITAPPVFALLNIFARPDPLVHDIEVAAHRRLSIAFFRRELIYRSVPVLLSFVIIIVLIHALNVSLNPMTAPDPIPGRESADENLLRIPGSGGMGDLTDGKLRKFVYFYGTKQIIFIAILKPDGSVGLALDECEICKPAEWNKAAQGYAQRGEHLICKYCMTPIAISTVNNPGGRNPIPLPFKLDDRQMVIGIEDLIRVYKEARALEKKGTHL